MNSEELSELRLFYLASNAILPLINDQHSQAYDRLLTRFRSGETNLLSSIAECSAHKTLIEEIENKLHLYETINQENT